MVTNQVEENYAAHGKITVLESTNLHADLFKKNVTGLEKFTKDFKNMYANGKKKQENQNKNIVVDG